MEQTQSLCQSQIQPFVQLMCSDDSLVVQGNSTYPVRNDGYAQVYVKSVGRVGEKAIFAVQSSLALTSKWFACERHGDTSRS
jgi:hypothetical protein